MLKAMEELFLSQYFMLEGMLGRLFMEKRNVFFALASAFCIDDPDANRLYIYTNDANVRSISSEQEFYQFIRIQKYLSMSGQMSGNERHEIDNIIIVKGNALSTLVSHGLKCHSDVTTADIYQELLAKKTSGDILVIRMLGLMQCEGIFFEKNLSEGIRNLSAVSLWDDLCGIILALHYDESHREKLLGRLCAAVTASPYEGLREKCKIKYRLDSYSRPAEREILIKAFSRGILKRDIYETAYANVLKSSSLSNTEKESLVLSCEKNKVLLAGELPLDLQKYNILPFGDSSFKQIPIYRPSEIAQIRKYTNNMDLIGLDDYKPMCVCSSSDFALRMYYNGLKPASDKVHMEVINATSLTENDLESNEGNLFVRSCKSDAINVYFIVCCGNVSSRALEQIQNFLQTSKRRRFCLNRPCITLDLSLIVPVCFCDTDNVKHFRKFCDVVQIQPIKDEEKNTVVNQIIQEKKRRYSLTELDLDDDLYNKMAEINIDNFDSAVDCAIRNNRSDTINLTYPMISEYIESSRKNNKYGFSEAIENGCR